MLPEMKCLAAVVTEGKHRSNTSPVLISEAHVTKVVVELPFPTPQGEHNRTCVDCPVLIVPTGT